MKKLVGLFLIIVFMSCSSSGDDPEPIINAPIASNYIAPTNNAVCTGEVLSETEIKVNFQWNPFQDIEDTNLTYTFTLRNLSTNTVVVSEMISATTTSTTLERGVSYSWNIMATDTDSNSTQGATWQFQTPFNAVSNHVPFPATLISPNNAEVLNDTNISLVWEGNDPDEGETEELVYTVYLGTTNPPVEVANMLTTETYTEMLTTGIYFWKIDSTDPNGNVSQSQIRQFSIE